MTDTQWVINQCLHHIPNDAETCEAMLLHGLKCTESSTVSFLFFFPPIFKTQSYLFCFLSHTPEQTRPLLSPNFTVSSRPSPCLQSMSVLFFIPFILFFFLTLITLGFFFFFPHRWSAPPTASHSSHANISSSATVTCLTLPQTSSIRRNSPHCTL